MTNQLNSQITQPVRMVRLNAQQLYDGFAQARYLETRRGIVALASGWLHESPRTTIDILLALFPGEVNRMKDVVEMIPMIENLMVLEGYLPNSDADPMEVKWWQGNPQGSRERDRTRRAGGKSKTRAAMRL